MPETPTPDPIVVLADAINQLAIQVELLAWRSVNEIGGKDYNHIHTECRKLRDTLAPLLPE